MSVDAAPLPLDFHSLDLPDATIRALKRQGITTPTPIQAAVIPDGIAGRDVLARARTGSGKTLAFGVSALVRLHGGRTESKRPRGLIVVPTRELANQVRIALEPIAESLQLRVATIYGGTPYDKQIRQLRAGADVVVATPGVSTTSSSVARAGWTGLRSSSWTRPTTCATSGSTRRWTPSSVRRRRAGSACSCRRRWTGTLTGCPVVTSGIPSATRSTPQRSTTRR